MLAFLHAGTEACWNMVAPQTGKAEEGVCPSVLQACDEPSRFSPAMQYIKKHISLNLAFIIAKISDSIDYPY